MGWGHRAGGKLATPLLLVVAACGPGEPGPEERALCEALAGSAGAALNTSTAGGEGAQALPADGLRHAVSLTSMGGTDYPNNGGFLRLDVQRAGTYLLGHNGDSAIDVLNADGATRAGTSPVDGLAGCPPRLYRTTIEGLQAGTYQLRVKRTAAHFIDMVLVPPAE